MMAPAEAGDEECERHRVRSIAGRERNRHAVAEGQRSELSHRSETRGATGHGIAAILIVLWLRTPEARPIRAPVRRAHDVHCNRIPIRRINATSSARDLLLAYALVAW